MKNIKNDQFIEMIERLSPGSSVQVSTVDAFSSAADKTKLVADIEKRLNKTGAHYVVFLIEV